jgi:hypothetical protein
MGWLLPVSFLGPRAVRDIHSVDAAWTKAAHDHGCARLRQPVHRVHLLQELLHWREKIRGTLNQELPGVPRGDLFAIGQAVNSALDTLRAVSGAAHVRRGCT